MPAILLVDDTPAIRTLVREILRDPGYRILEAATGEEALEIGESADLLLTDIGLPGMNGIELARQLRQRRPDLKVICMSGYALPVQPLENVWFLEKPFGPEVLLTRIREALAAGP